MNKRLVIVILLAISVPIIITVALNLFDKKDNVGPGAKDAPFVAVSLSRVYYLADRGDIVYNPDTEINTIYRYWYTAKGKWKYTEDVMVLPVNTFGPIEVRQRAIQ